MKRLCLGSRPAALQGLTMSVLVAATLVATITRGYAEDTWTEDTFEDFSDGHLDAGGQNLYVSREGSIRTIHRFDLNQDGYIDLVFNSTHDTVTDLPATQGWFDADGALHSAQLPVGGSLHVAIGDLNRDGRADAAFCPNRGGVQQGRQFVTIGWGGPGGWESQRLTRLLPVHEARKIAIVDLNADQWPDLAVLNGRAWQHGQPAGDIVRIYWGFKEGYLLTRYTDCGVDAAVDLIATDLDGDGASDAAVLRSDAIEILWSSSTTAEAPVLERSTTPLPAREPACLAILPVSKAANREFIVGTRQGVLLRIPIGTKRTFGEVTVIDAVAATHVSAGDLDQDGNPDLVLANFESGRAAGGEAAAARSAEQGLQVLWGSAAGFSTQAITQIPVTNVAATAIGDLNADGVTDIAAAIYQGTETFATDSIVLQGKGSRQFARTRRELPTVGASAVAIVTAEDDVPARALYCSSVGGTLREEVPLQLYWGGAEGFDTQRQTVVPFTSGYESTAADFDLDGHVDLIELNSGHSGAISLSDPTLGINLFPGSKEGFDFVGRRTTLREENLGTSNTADLNRDGYLDLIAGQFSASSDAAETCLFVYYGGEQGFTRDNRYAIPCPGRSISTVIADFNRDEWLDVAVAAMTAERVRILWGGKDGFAAERKTEIPLHSAIDVETADLNVDGWSDLIVGCYADAVTHEHDLGSHILWGSEEGFRQSNSQWLPGFTPIGHCVADFDADGHLDLFSPHYHGNGTRETIPSYLFWGSAEGFDATRFTELICDSADDALAADFDRDGKLDLAVVNHARNGAHHTVSRVFYNDGQHFKAPRIQTLPTHGPHWMWQEDMGHIQHRRWEQRYESSVHEFNKPFRSAHLDFDAERPEETTLTFQIRTASNATQLERSTWQDVTDQFKLDDSNRVIQYAAVLKSDNGDRYPVLKRVSIRLK